MMHNWRKSTLIRLFVALVATIVLGGLTFVVGQTTAADAQQDEPLPPPRTILTTADMRDVYLSFADFERELQSLFDTGIITMGAYNDYFANTDLYALAGQGPDAEIDVDPDLQRTKWDALGIDDYEFIYQDTCFCYWPDEVAPGWRVRVIDGVVVEAVSVTGGGAVNGLTMEQIFKEINDAAAANPALLTAKFDLLYGYPTTWFADQDERIADEEFGQVVSSFTPLQHCGDERYAPIGSCAAEAEIQVDRTVYEGNVECANGLEPLPDDYPWPGGGRGRTTICYAVTNVGGALAEDVSFSDEEYGLVDVQLGDLNPGESIEYRHFVDESSAEFLADMRDSFLSVDDLAGELDGLVTLNIISADGLDRYRQITDVYSLAGQGPDAIIAVDPYLQRTKWETLGIDDYEFDYRDNCFCYWSPESAPPWRVQVLDGEAISAVSIDGGGVAPATTIDAIFDRIERSRAGEPFRIEASYDLLYGYPTSWYSNIDRRIADEEFGQQVLDFRPLRACHDQAIPADEPCVGVVWDLALYAGEVDCETPASQPIDDDVFVLGTVFTVCVTITNFGDETATDVIVSADDLPFPFEITIAEIGPAETVVERSVISRTVRDYQLEPEQPDTAAEIDRALTELVDTGTISTAERDAWFAVSDLNGPVPGVTIFQTQLNKWQALGLDDYEFTYRQFCFCPPEVNEPVRVRVVNGEVVSPIDDDYLRPLTVGEMFERIDPDSTAFSITATFDRLYGVPTNWAIDSIELAVDDEISVSISDFVPLIECNGELIELDTECADEPDCSDWSRRSRRGQNWWHSCWLEVLRQWLEQLDNDWAKAWGVSPP